MNQFRTIILLNQSNPGIDRTFNPRNFNSKPNKFYYIT